MFPTWEEKDELRKRHTNSLWESSSGLFAGGVGLICYTQRICQSEIEMILSVGWEQRCADVLDSLSGFPFVCFDPTNRRQAPVVLQR